MDIKISSLYISSSIELFKVSQHLTTNIWDQMIFVCAAILCIMAKLALSLVSIH